MFLFLLVLVANVWRRMFILVSNMKSINNQKKITYLTIIRRSLLEKWRNANSKFEHRNRKLMLWSFQVKLAEDMVARGTLTSSCLNQLIQSHLNSTPQHFNRPNLHRTVSVSPTITVQADHHDNPYAGIMVSGQNSSLLGLGNPNFSSPNITAGMLSDAVSSVSEIWQ